jgi:predicted alpha-1,6-mannanase (GH76 family)
MQYSKIATGVLLCAQNANGDAWYTEATGFFGMTWESKVYYCPAPTSGPAHCVEARYEQTSGGGQ